MFKSKEDYISKRSDIKFWLPYIQEALDENKLSNHYIDIVAGDNPTYPVFVLDDKVVKFFGYIANWVVAHNTEKYVHECIAKDKEIKAPKILKQGCISTSWPYIVYERVSGQALKLTELSKENRTKLAKDIGVQLKAVHNLPIPVKLNNTPDIKNLDIEYAASKSILPPHLVKQANDFIKKIDNFDMSLVNGDIVDTHIFVKGGSLSGIIDWGDATVFDKHYELGKLMDTFNWDKGLLKSMLDAYGWNINHNFAQKSLCLSLYRQAVGLTQHTTFDVFYKLPYIYNLDAIKDLDELSETLFGVSV